MMEFEELSFTGTLSNLKIKGASKRDPRQVRLASVTDALTDVIEGDVTPSKLFASAITTLEGTLHQSNDDGGNALDSLMTQTSLLEIIRLSLPHVPCGVASATLSTSIKTLKYVLSFCKSVAAADDGTRMSVLETKDELGGITALVCKTCQVAAAILKRLPSSTPSKNIKSILHTFFWTFAGDSRSKLKNVVTSELCGILSDSNTPCHSIVYKETTNFVCGHFDKFISKQRLSGSSQLKTSLLDLMEFVQPLVMVIDFSAVGSKLMVLLLKCMNEVSLSSQTSSDFVVKKQDKAEDIAVINALLATILSMLEFEVNSDETTKNLSHFAARVLASLVQEKPALIFADGMCADEDLLINGRTIYGQVMLSACQRLLESNQNEQKTGYKLLPLTIQQLLNLSKANSDDPDADGGESTVMVSELSQIVRTHLGPIKTADPSLFESCSRDCLHILQTVLTTPGYQHTWSGSLLALAILLQQMEPADQDVKSCVQSLVEARCMINNYKSKNLEGAVNVAIRALVQGIGIQYFWELADLTKFCTGQANQAQLHWLLDTMKASGTLDNEGRLQLSFFQEKVLHLARHFDVLAVNSPEKAPMLKGRVVDLWGLFPSFCRYPNDIAESFPKLAPLLMRAMNDDRYPQLVVS